MRMIRWITATLGTPVWRAVKEIAVQHPGFFALRVGVHVLLDVLGIKIVKRPPAATRGDNVGSPSSFTSGDQLSIGVVTALLSRLVLNTRTDGSHAPR